MSPELEEHVRQLARELGVTIIPPWAADPELCEQPCGASGYLQFEEGEPDPIIWVSRDPVDAEAYLVALHELGHHATARPGPCSLLIEGEERAWLWAEQQSLIPITPRLRRFIERRLDSYRD